MTEAAVRRRSWPRRLGRIALWLLAILVLVFAIAWLLARPAMPDAFYDPPPNMPRQPGLLLRAEPFAQAPTGGRAWRILYTTTRIDGSPAAASAIVMTSARPFDAPRPVIAWAHGTTGIVAGCAPSLIGPYENVPAVDALVSQGWVYVATDYAGLGTPGGHAYLVGDDAARAILDSVRASRQLRDVRLDDRTVVWGHSQGGGSALWTGMQAAAYAPDVPLAGVVAMAPASDLPALLERSRGGAFGKIVSAYAIHAYARTYPDVRVADYVPWHSRWLAGDIAGRCLGRAGLFSALQTILLPADGIFAGSPSQGAFGRRLAENVPSGPISTPLLIAQGEADSAISPDIQRAYVAARCAAGQRLDLRTYAGRDHLTLLTADSPFTPELVAWTRDRFAGRPAPATCG